MFYQIILCGNIVYFLHYSCLATVYSLCAVVTQYMYYDRGKSFGGVLNSSDCPADSKIYSLFQQIPSLLVASSILLLYYLCIRSVFWP